MKSVKKKDGEKRHVKNAHYLKRPKRFTNDKQKKVRYIYYFDLDS